MTDQVCTENKQLMETISTTFYLFIYLLIKNMVTTELKKCALWGRSVRVHL